MSLDFSVGSTDKVTLTSAASLDDIFTGTIMMWLLPTDITTDDDMVLLDKGGNDTWALYGNFDFNLNFEIGRATTSCAMLIPFSNFAVFGQDKWLFLGVSFDSSGADADQITVMGDTFTPAAVPLSYNTQQVGTGTEDTNESDIMIIGNRSNNSRNPLANIGYLHILDTNLSIDEMISRQFRDPSHPNSVFKGLLGFDGTNSVPDWSGNGNDSVSITGTSLGDFYPWALRLPPPFYGFQEAAAAAAFANRMLLTGVGV